MQIVFILFKNTCLGEQCAGLEKIFSPIYLVENMILQILRQISFQIDCVLQNAILNVPSAGCNLPYLQNQIIQVDQIIQNGQFAISRYANLQYKTLAVDNRAAMNLESNYEQIKILQTQEQAANFAYIIYSIYTNNQLTLKDQPLGLLDGVNILISSLSGLTEYAVVDKVVDQLIVIDEQRIIFKRACLRIFPYKPQSSQANSGIFFQDMKGLSYENQDPTKIVEVTHSIFLNSDTFKNQFYQIQLKISNIYYCNSWYNNDCQVILALNNNQASYKLQNSNFLNTRLAIFNAQPYDLLLLSNCLLNFVFITNNSYINTLIAQINNIAGKELNLQNVINTQANIQGHFFDGTGLKYAILITDLSVLQQQSAFLTLELDGDTFQNFEYQGYDLITTTLKSSNYQETVLRSSQFQYEITLKINQFYILPSSQQKYYLAIIQFDVGQVTDYYMDTQTQEFKQTLQTGTSYYLLEDTIQKVFFKSTINNQLSAAPQQLNFVVYQGSVNTFNAIPQVKIYFKQSTPIQTISVKINRKTVASPKYVQLDPIDECLNIYLQSNNDQQDITINITITNCQNGQVLSNQQCVSSCPGGQFALNSICLDGSQKNGYYFKNNYYLQYLGGQNNQYKTCTDSNNCQACQLSQFTQNNLFFANQHRQFYSAGSFQNCIQNCQSCSDQLTCSVCVDGYALSQDKKSCNLCPQGNFIKDNLCTPCLPNFNCADCFSDQGGTCRQCKPGFTLFEGLCQQTCTQGQYLDNNCMCQSFDPSCLECSGSRNTKCTRCSNGQILKIQFPSQTCEQSPSTNLIFQNNSNQCQNCFDQTNQNGCFDAYPYSIICDQGQYAQYNVSGCQICDASCKTCVYQSTNCIQCNLDYTFISGNNGQCQKSQDGFYAPLNAKTCLNCISSCKSCSGSSYNCQTCLDGFYYDKSSQQCAKCDPSCSKCSESSTNCTQCQKGLFFNNRKFIKCDINCQECTNTSIYCTKCPQSTYLSSNKCLNQCPVGQYGDSQLGICQDCDKTKCKQCQGTKDFCTLCNQNLIIQEGICVTNCSEGYILSNIACIKQTDSRNELKPGALVGIVFGSFIFLIFVIIAVCYFYKKRKYKSLFQIDPNQNNFKNNEVITNNQLQTQQDIETINQLEGKKNEREAKEQTEVKSNELNI
ncbi:hypothetical protein ABPG72_017177 [Tetrahymena utriculariae]